MNLSQSQIWNNEIAYPSSNINLISARLFIEDCTIQEAKAAVDKVIASSDVFSAQVVREDFQAHFELMDHQDVNSSITKEMSLGEIEKHVEKYDEIPLHTACLYEVQLIPVKEGGVVVFSRFHHVIMDGYSMTLYSQYILDALAGKEVQESRFFEEECELENEKIEQQSEDLRALWTEYLRGAECSSEIFGAVTEGITKTEYRQAVATELKDKIYRYAEEGNYRLPFIYMAAHAIYLARATRQKEAMILMSRLGRKREQMRTLGCYVLIVPVRITVEEEDTFEQVYEKALASSNIAASGKEFGFDNILKVAKEEGITPETLSANVYSYFRHKMDSEMEFHLDVSAAAMHNDLTFNVVAFDKEIEFSLDLADKVYDKSKGIAFIESISNILEQSIDGARVGDLVIVSQHDKEKVMGIKGKTIELNPKDTIISLFERVVKEYPDRMALYAGTSQLTFAQLDSWSDKIAGNLQKRGISHGDVVSILLGRDIRLIPTIFGVLKTGASFVPIDTKYPEERIRYIIEDSKSKYLISTAEVGLQFCDWVEVDELLAEEAVCERPSITREDKAYMIYTSGTTGTPKGVKIAHRGIVNIVQPGNNPFNKEITRNARGLVAVGSISFDISLYEIFVPLLNGLFIELAPEEALTDPRKLARLLTAHGADVMHCTPSRLASYLKLEEFKLAFKSVKAVLSAGEVLYGSLVDSIRNSFGVKIYNGYGPTETTIGATITEAYDNMSIGKPIANMGILILDAKNRALPYGAVGEICIYGEGLGLGYQNLPEQTAEKFTRFENIDIYRTGDLGYLNSDGRLMYRGRNDRQIKLRGLRIELGEIEQSISAIEGVSSVVCMVKMIAKQQHLIGYYDTVNHQELDEAVIKQTLQAKLPYYMVPEVLINVGEMPQTPSGKVDQKALAQYPVEIKRLYVEPANAMEKVICKAFAEVIGIEQVGAEDNFFDAGGDSLGAAMLMLRLEEDFQEGCIEVADIYKYLTPRNISKKILEVSPEKEANYLEGLDYLGFKQALKIPTNISDETNNLGNVLLTGVTGYLGVHILYDLLMRPEQYQKIYCVARNKGKLEAKKRVLTSLFYYTENDFADIYGERWEVIEGDITHEDMYQKLEGIHIDTVINSAANVAHFAKEEELTSANTDSVRRLIEYCLEQNAKLCQVSTISVAGSYLIGKEPLEFSEEKFFIGQEIQNQYLLSKSIAEYEMIRASIDKGLKIKIIRVGNLQGRISDGEFQMNMKSNAFSRRILSFIKIGAVPYSAYNSQVNFSPVDETAHMLVTLCTTANEQCAFNLYPPEDVAFSRIIAILNDLDCPIRIVDDKEFKEIIDELKKTPEGRKIVEGILIEKKDLNYEFVGVNSKYTQDILDVHKEAWTEIQDEYLHKCFLGLTDMLMF